MNLDITAVQRYRLYSDAEQLLLLESGKYPVKGARFGPAAHPGINGVPVAKLFRQPAPLAAVL